MTTGILCHSALVFTQCLQLDEIHHEDVFMPITAYMNQTMGRKGHSFSSKHKKVLPDLNSIEAAVLVVHPPFTDSQQVQLRAQILVYGSLLKGIVPDEVAMVAAFDEINRGSQGAEDGVRLMKYEWEKSWRVAAERLKFILATSEQKECAIPTITGPSSAAVVTASFPIQQWEPALQTETFRPQLSSPLLSAGSSPIQGRTSVSTRDEPGSSHSQQAASEPMSQKKMKSLVDLPVNICCTVGNSLTPADLIVGGGRTLHPDTRTTEPQASLKKTPDEMEHAKSISEEAMLAAALAVRHSESVWKQAQDRKHSGLLSGREAELATTSAVIAAAALVSKAAAAAAGLAYEAALRSNLVEVAHTPGVEGNAKPDSSLLSTWQIPLSYKATIHSAREAAEKQLEFASAAKRRAENLGVIVRAAELAATAVSHVGTVVALGNSACAKTDEVPEKAMLIQSNVEIPGPISDSRKQDKVMEVLASYREVHFLETDWGAELHAQKENALENLRQNEAKSNERGQNPVDAVLSPGDTGRSLITCGLQIEEGSAVEDDTSAEKPLERDKRLNEREMALLSSELQLKLLKKNKVATVRLRTAKVRSNLGQKDGAADQSDGILSEDGKQKPPSDFHMSPRSIAFIRNTTVWGQKWNVLGQDAQKLDTDGKRKTQMLKERASKRQRPLKSAKSGASSAQTEMALKVRKQHSKSTVAGKKSKDRGTEGFERRRSNRVRQPTSKLLEGFETTSIPGRSSIS